MLGSRIPDQPPFFISMNLSRCQFLHTSGITVGIPFFETLAPNKVNAVETALPGFQSDGMPRRGEGEVSGFEHASRRLGCIRLMMSLVMLVCCGLFSLAERVVYAEDNVVSERGTAEQRFAREVWPLLSEKCLACHGRDPEKIKGGLDLTTSAGVKRGGESGEAAIVPGKPQLSPLFLSVTRSHADWSAMPPKDNDALTPAQVETLRRWIRDGAVWIEGDALVRHALSAAAAEGEVRVLTSRALDPAWEARSYAEKDLWAYRPLQKVVPPDATTNPIDAFLNARMKSESVPSAARADARSLVRRATMDLTGLLPTVEEVERFAADKQHRRVACADRPPARLTAIRRSDGASLAGCGALCGQRGIFERLRSCQRVALPGLRHPEFQPRHAVRPFRA